MSVSRPASGLPISSGRRCCGLAGTCSIERYWGPWHQHEGISTDERHSFLPSRIIPGTVLLLDGMDGLAAAGRLWWWGGAAPATLQSVAVVPGNSSVKAGASMPLVATATYSDNSSMDVTSQASWVFIHWGRGWQRPSRQSHPGRRW